MSDKNQPYAILVAVQDDDTADLAIAEAFRIAEGHVATALHAVHVVRSPAAGADAAVAKLDKRLQNAPKVLEEAIGRAAPQDSDTRVIGHIRAHERPAHAILQTAADIAADLIILGTHRRRGLERLMLGSVADQVLRDAHCPVLVVVNKDYKGEATSTSVAPPCPACMEVRRQTSGATFWCERHVREYQQPHVYVPSDPKRSSIMASQ